MPLALRVAVVNEVYRLEREGVIQPAQSQWSTPLVLFRKNDGSIILMGRLPNAATEKSGYPLSITTEVLLTLRGATIFSTLDPYRAY